MFITNQLQLTLCIEILGSFSDPRPFDQEFIFAKNCFLMTKKSISFGHFIIFYRRLKYPCLLRSKKKITKNSPKKRRFSQRSLFINLLIKKLWWWGWRVRREKRGATWLGGISYEKKLLSIILLDGERRIVKWFDGTGSRTLSSSYRGLKWGVSLI